jgi:hypothetical protein
MAGTQQHVGLTIWRAASSPAASPKIAFASQQPAPKQQHVLPIATLKATPKSHTAPVFWGQAAQRERDSFDHDPLHCIAYNLSLNQWQASKTNASEARAGAASGAVICRLCRLYSNMQFTRQIL